MTACRLQNECRPFSYGRANYACGAIISSSPINILRNFFILSLSQNLGGKKYLIGIVHFSLCKHGEKEIMCLYDYDETSKGRFLPTLPIFKCFSISLQITCHILLKDILKIYETDII